MSTTGRRSEHGCTAAAPVTAIVIAFLLAAPATARAQARNDGGSVVQQVAASRDEAPPTSPVDPAVYRAARAYSGPKILVSLNERRLLLVAGRDTLVDTAVGVGTGADFEYEGRRFRFDTPTGRRTVIAKAPDPVWTPPDWHYMEKAVARGLELVRLKDGDSIPLSDGSRIVVADGEVGRVNQFGNFWAFRPGMEILFDGKIFMPPFGTAQRRVPGALGPYKLELGDAYMIHGTNPFTEETIGGAVSHGCVRVPNDQVARLYELVRVGTPVFIY